MVRRPPRSTLFPSAPLSRSVSTDFSQGDWVNLPINVAAGGLATITVTPGASPNADLGGIFLGGVPPTPAPPTGRNATPPDATDISLGWSGSRRATSYKLQLP